MYRVELKGPLQPLTWEATASFLMYRVELKEIPKQDNAISDLFVPNVPCGVESPDTQREAS